MGNSSNFLKTLLQGASKEAPVLEQEVSQAAPELSEAGKAYLANSEKQAAAPLSSVGEQVSPESAQTALEEAQRAQAALKENLSKTPTEPVNTAEKSAKVFEENPPQAPATESAEAFQEKTPKELELDKADQDLSNIKKEPKINPSAEQETPDLKSDINPSEESLVPNQKSSVLKNADDWVYNNLSSKTRDIWDSLTPKERAVIIAGGGAAAGTALYNSLKTPETVSSNLIKEKYNKDVPIVSKKEEEPEEDQDIKAQQKDIKKQIAALDEQHDTKKGDINDVIDFGQSNFNPSQELAQAKSQREKELGLNNLGRAADILTGGLLHQGPKLEKFYDEQDKLSGRFIDDVKSKIAVQQDDPNSSVSKGVRDMMKQYGISITGDAPASVIFKMMPGAEKKYLNEQNRQTQKENLQYKYAELEKLAEAKKSDKQTQQDEKTAENISKKLNGLQAASRTAIGKAAQANVSADRLIDIANNPKSTAQDLSSAAADLNQIVSGTATITGSRHQEYSSLANDFAKAVQYITSNPQAPNVPEIKQHLVDVAKRMKKISEDTLNQNTKLIQAGNEEWIKRHPDQWNRMVSAANGQTSSQESISTGPHGNTVTQGGHTYTWNPSTGKYE